MLRRPASRKWTRKWTRKNEQGEGRGDRALLRRAGRPRRRAHALDPRTREPAHRVGRRVLRHARGTGYACRPLRQPRRRDVDDPRRRPPVSSRRQVERSVANASYTLNDMADDAVGLLGALDIESAHVVGVSLGAMIGQTMAVRHPTTRAEPAPRSWAQPARPDVGMPSPEAARSPRAGAGRGAVQAYIEGELANHRVIGSQGCAGGRAVAPGPLRALVRPGAASRRGGDEA